MGRNEQHQDVRDGCRPSWEASGSSESFPARSEAQDASEPDPSPERRATFSPADEVHEFRGRAPTCYTTRLESSPGS